MQPVSALLFVKYSLVLQRNLTYLRKKITLSGDFFILIYTDDIFYLRLIVETEFAFRGERYDARLGGIDCVVAAERCVFACESIVTFLEDDDRAELGGLASVKLHAQVAWV